MTRVILHIKDHADRMDMIRALQRNGYVCGVGTKTEYMETQTVVWVDVKEYEVKE